jgi:hypothetical protein
VSGALAAAVLAFTWGAAGAAASPPDVWKRLHRPLHVPTVAHGRPCPVSKLDAGFPFAKFGVVGGLGAGPVYPMLNGSSIALADVAGSPWDGQQVLWFVAPTYRGPVLVRGTRLDRSGFVRFNPGRRPGELRIPVGSSHVAKPGVPAVGQRYRSALTRVSAPGCYAYQVDGTTFSRVIVFQAMPVP